jgi:hypothetical protein
MRYTDRGLEFAVCLEGLIEELKRGGSNTETVFDSDFLLKAKMFKSQGLPKPAILVIPLF